MNLYWKVLIALLILVTFGCDEDFLNIPTIVSLEIEPDTLRTSQTGMTDEYFSVRIQVENFTEPIDLELSKIFIQEADEREAFPEVRDMEGDVIIFDDIVTGWFGGLAPGEYNIGAEILSEPGETGRSAERARELNLAVVTLEE